MGAAELCAALSRPFPSPITVGAANDFLAAADPSATLDRVYHFLVWQKTLRTALNHLEAAGADLDALTITPARFASTFPRGYNPVWNTEADDPVTARQLVETYAMHRALLADPVAGLLDRGFGDFTLLSGRAYEVRFPWYSGRVEFDTDLLVPSVESAMAAAAILEQMGFSLDTVRVRRLGATPDATVEIRRSTNGHLVSVGILVGGYHAYRGPVHEMAQSGELRGRLVRVPRLEHLLLMLAARAERKRRFAIVNVNDAAVILSESASALDWDLVVAEACAAGLNATLAVILGHAEKLLPHGAVPESVSVALGRGDPLRLRVARLTSSGDMRFGDSTAEQRIARRIWLADVAQRRLRRSDTPGLWSGALLRAQRRLRNRQIRSASSGAMTGMVDGLATRSRTRSGAFCEIAEHLAGDATCVSHSGSWRGNKEARAHLTSCAVAFAAPPGEHRCNRMLFDLADKRGT